MRGVYVIFFRTNTSSGKYIHINKYKFVAEKSCNSPNEAVKN